MLKISNLSSGYGKLRVLNNISLDIENGSVGLFGPNGAGKTTLINTILGLVAAQNGELSFEGQDITKLPAHKRVRMGISVVPQERELFPTLTVYDNLVIGGENIPRVRMGSFLF